MKREWVLSLTVSAWLRLLVDDMRLLGFAFVDKAFPGLTAPKIVCMCEAAGDPARIDFALLTHVQRVDELTRLQRERARLDAREARLLHAMHADPLPNLDGSPAVDRQWVREDVACVLRIACFAGIELHKHIISIVETRGYQRACRWLRAWLFRG